MRRGETERFGNTNAAFIGGIFGRDDWSYSEHVDRHSVVAAVVAVVTEVVAVWRTPHFSGKQSGLPFLVVVMLVTVLKIVNPVNGLADDPQSEQAIV